MRLLSIAGLLLLAAGCSATLQSFGGGLGSGRAPTMFWPPPPATAVTEGAPAAGMVSFGEAEAQLDRTLREAGHAVARALPIGGRHEHGFARITRLERIHDDGSPDTGPARWSTLYPEPANLRWLEGALTPRLPGPGRFRVLLIAFTDLPVVAKGRPPAWDFATLMESTDAPPPLPASRRASAGYRLVYLVYEFRSTRADGAGERLNEASLAASASVLVR